METKSRGWHTLLHDMSSPCRQRAAVSCPAETCRQYAIRCGRTWVRSCRYAVPARMARLSSWGMKSVGMTYCYCAVRCGRTYVRCSTCCHHAVILRARVYLGFHEFWNIKKIDIYYIHKLLCFSKVEWGEMDIADTMSHLIFSHAIHFFVTVLCFYIR